MKKKIEAVGRGLWVPIAAMLVVVGCPQSKPDTTPVSAVGSAPATAGKSSSRPAGSRPIATRAASSRPGTAVKPTAPADAQTAPSDSKASDVGKMAATLVAKRHELDVADIVVDTVEPMEWPDSSLGCPQPGQFYMQMITPGHKVKLHVGERVFFVHEAKGRGIICKPGLKGGGIQSR